MLVEVDGNLLDSDCAVIIHQANCHNVMGAGFALQVKTRFPKVYQADIDFPAKGIDRLGKTSRAWDKGKLFFNLYSQLHFGGDRRHTNYEALATGLEGIMGELRVWKPYPKIGLPYGMGCGLAGGDWNVVSAIINSVTKDDIVYAYKYSPK